MKTECIIVLYMYLENAMYLYMEPRENVTSKNLKIKRKVLDIELHEHTV